MLCSNCNQTIPDSSNARPFCGADCSNKPVKTEKKHTKKFILISVLAVFIALLGCTGAKVGLHRYHNRVSFKIYHQLEAKTKDTREYPKEINLADFTDFEWDEVIVYGLTTVDDVEKEFGIKPEIKKKDAWIQGVIFYYQNKVVHNECYTFDFDDIPKDKIAIYPATFSDNNKRVRLKQEQSFFSVHYYEEGFYRLFPK